MKVIRVFPRRTSMTPEDDMVFVGQPGLFRPEADEVHISIAFTWDVEEGIRLRKAWKKYYPIVRIGGPAFGQRNGAFETGRYLKTGVTITTRGCPNKCPWCLVDTPFHELDKIEPGWIVQDDNILISSRKHLRKVFKMLDGQGKAAKFSGGLEAKRLTNWHIEKLRSLRIDELWFAADSWEGFNCLKKLRPKLRWLARQKKRCYVLIGRGGLADCEARLEAVWDLGFMPFAQLYQPKNRIEYDREWKALARKWSRPAAMVVSHKEKK